MSDRFSDSDAAREALSSLADGEAQPGEVARACGAWKDQADARATWHTYHLIGDVMRSDDLARAGRSDVFLKNFRERLAQEPVVLAPSAANAQRHAASRPAARAQAFSFGSESRPLRRRAWAGPMAVAAGFVLVVGALVNSQMLQGPGAATSGGTLASSASSLSTQGFSADGALASGFVPGAAQTDVAGVTNGASFSRPEPSEAVLMRDPQLEQALAEPRDGSVADQVFSRDGASTQHVVFVHP